MRLQITLKQGERDKLWYWIIENGRMMILPKAGHETQKEAFCEACHILENFGGKRIQ